MLRIRAEHPRFLIRQGRPQDALTNLGEIQLGLVADYGENGIYPALASANQGLALLELDRGVKALAHLDAARKVLEREESRQIRHRNLLAEIEMALGSFNEKRAAEAARMVPQGK